jgi:hypothetical protein
MARTPAADRTAAVSIAFGSSLASNALKKTASRVALPPTCAAIMTAAVSAAGPQALSASRWVDTRFL